MALRNSEVITTLSIDQRRRFLICDAVLSAVMQLLSQCFAFD